MIGLGSEADHCEELGMLGIGHPPGLGGGGVRMGLSARLDAPSFLGTYSRLVIGANQPYVIPVHVKTAPIRPS